MRMAGRKQTPLMPERVELHACTLPRRLRVLHHTPFFASLSEDDVSRISALFREKAFHAGEMVYVAGEPAIRLYILATTDGKNVVLGILGPGDFFGSLSMLGDKTYPDIAVAQTDCCVLGIAAGDFQGKVSCLACVFAISKLVLSDQDSERRVYTRESCLLPIHSRFLEIENELGCPYTPGFTQTIATALRWDAYRWNIRRIESTRRLACGFRNRLKVIRSTPPMPSSLRIRFGSNKCMGAKICQSS